MDQSLEALTRGLASLDIVQTAISPSPATSTPVGGARPKVHRSPRMLTCNQEVKVESREQSRSAPRSKPEAQVCRSPDVLSGPMREHTALIFVHVHFCVAIPGCSPAGCHWRWVSWWSWPGSRGRGRLWRVGLAGLSGAHVWRTTRCE